MFNKIETAASFIKSKIEGSPEIGLILGSGLGVLADEIENPITIPYHEIPEFPVSTVEGHAGQLVIGQLSGKKLSRCKDVSTFMRVTPWKRSLSLSV